MQCPKCQFENREGVKFCIECGNRLDTHCSNCKHFNPPGSKFCEECGSTLRQTSEKAPKALSFDEKLEKIQKYLPKGLTEKILSQRDKIEGERKHVTVMFCDMAGFTKLSEKIGPEEGYSIMDQIYEILIHKVHDYEGTVNEMTGDGIMALFGAPITLEDASQRAIRSAYAIHREINRFNEKMKKRQRAIEPVKMRIGIHTGYVVVGSLGNDLRVEFKAVGDTVNLASRMEGLAGPGTTYVTEETFKLTEGFFRFEAMGEKEIKGKEQLAKVYRVIAPSAKRTTFDVSAERGLTPFVGRERALELLLDGFERSKTGRGQAFSILSEAGVGKSRLLYEFRKAVSNEDVTFLEGRCLSYGRGVVYHPVIDILRLNFNIQAGDKDSEITEKVKRGLKILGAEEASTLPYLLDLLSVKDSGIGKITITPEGIKDRIVESLKRIVHKGSQIRPLIMAIEDLHWVDDGSNDVFKYLLESIPGLRVLLIFTYRPEYTQPWGAKSFHNQITLNRLSDRESFAMATHLLSKDLDRNLEKLILEKTEGVPFFIEEFIRSLKDLKIVESDGNKYYLTKDLLAVKIPSTIQEVIMARVDLLPEDAKKVLQAGSAIEREFSHELIKRVMNLSENELLPHLSAIKDSELLYERGLYPQSAYIFKHALTREVIYDSLLFKKKKNLHEKIGTALEDLKKENISDYYEALAEHFSKSENHEKAAEYSNLAGRKSAKKAFFGDAMEHLKKAALNIEKLPQTEDSQKKMIDFRTKIALYAVSSGRVHEIKEAVEPILDLTFHLQYKKNLPGILTAMGYYSFWIEEDFQKGFRYLNDVLKISEELNHFIYIWQTHYNLGWYLSWNCEFDKALESFDQCISLSELANNRLGTCTVKSTVAAHSLVLRGKIDRAYQISREAIEIANETDDIFSKATAYTSYGIACYFKGFFDDANRYLLKAKPLLERVSQLAWDIVSLVFLGMLSSDIGEYENARNCYKKVIAVVMQNRLSPSWTSVFKSNLAKVTVLNKNFDINLTELFNYFENIKLKVCKGWIAANIGEIFLNMEKNSIAEAEIWIKKAIEANQKNDMSWFLGRNYAIYADLSMRKGERPNARENLSKAIEILKECGADGWVEKYEKELAAI